MLLCLAFADCEDTDLRHATLRATGAPAIAVASARGCAVERVLGVALESVDGVWLVPVEINGNRLRLLLDTGAERTLLTEAAVARLGMARDPHHQTRTLGIGGPSTTADANVSSFAIGGTYLPVPSVTVGGFTLPDLSGKALDGVLGADILAAFDIDLDTRSDRLTLYRARDCPQAGPPWQEPFLSLGTILLSRGRLLVPIVLDGTAGTATLDTGAQNTAISERMAEHVGVTTADLAHDRSITARGASAEQLAVRVHRFDHLRIGPMGVTAPLLPIVPLPQELGDGLAGADFLAGRRVWLSYASARVFVTPLAAAAPPVAMRMSR